MAERVAKAELAQPQRHIKDLCGTIVGSSPGTAAHNSVTANIVGLAHLALLVVVQRRMTRTVFQTVKVMSRTTPLRVRNGPDSDSSAALQG